MQRVEPIDLVDPQQPDLDACLPPAEMLQSLDAHPVDRVAVGRDPHPDAPVARRLAQGGDGLHARQVVYQPMPVIGRAGRADEEMQDAGVRQIGGLGGRHVGCDQRHIGPVVGAMGFIDRAEAGGCCGVQHVGVQRGAGQGHHGAGRPAPAIAVVQRIMLQQAGMERLALGFQQIGHRAGDLEGREDLGDHPALGLRRGGRVAQPEQHFGMLEEAAVTIEDLRHAGEIVQGSASRSGHDDSQPTH